MRTLALSLAAAVLGTGCIVTTSDPVGDVAIFWRFQNSQGALAGDFTAANSGCGDAGVTDVDVEIFRGNSRVVFQNFACESATGVPRALVTDLPTGTYDWQITAYRLSDPVFTDAGTVVVRDNATTEVTATAGVLVQAPLTMYYTLDGAFTCAGVQSIYYAVYNAANTVLVDSGTVPCDPGAFGFSLPPIATGLFYSVDFFQALSGGIAQYERCGFQVRNTGFPVVVDLLPAPDASCGP